MRIGRRATNWVVDNIGDPMGAAAGARLAAVLFVLCGALVTASTLLPAPEGADRGGLALIGSVAVLAGIAFWFLPWERWGRNASLTIEMPVAFALVTAHNWLTDADGYRFGIFFLVMFVWLGLTHPAGYSIRFAPVLVAAYAAPLLFRGAPEHSALASLFYAVPVCVLVGETGAAVAGRLRSSEAALRSSEQRWRSLVLNASDVIVVLDATGRVQYATPAAGRLFGYEDTVGVQVLELIHPDDLAFVVERLTRSVDLAAPGELIEFRVARADGEYVWVECLGTNLLDEPDVHGIVCNVRDISERKETERILRYRSKHDSLTDLPNRHDLVETVSERVDAGEPFALLLLDLDRFKEINDALGHETGDRVLVEVARRLAAQARKGDLVARLGGDEFAIVVNGATDDEAAGAVAADLLRVFDAPFEIDDMGLHVGASIGVAVSHAPDADDNVTVLLQRADVAMYRAKATGAGWGAFGIADEQNRPARLAMVGDLRDAIEAGEIEAYYQPQLALSTGEVRQVEVLARWKRLGVPVRPDVFVPLAEHTGLIGRLTTSILRQALAQAKRWADTGLPIAVAVNVSALTLREPSFLGSIIDALAEARVPPSTLTLEITESAMADHTDAAVAIMRELRSAGIRLSIDDFGSGYSSMAYLKRLPIDELKIDRGFVTDMLSDERDQPITRSIIELAHSLGLVVVAEGVESPALQTMLERFGCDAVQGYGICRPVPAEELTTWLAARVSTDAVLATAAPGAHLHAL
jgi:diguanylate cyclase (GGDEF)-like protein/PAS domain S-box-containing protein